MESILDEMRKSRMEANAEAVGILLSALDALKVMISGYLAGENPAAPQEIKDALAGLLGPAQDQAPQKQQEEDASQEAYKGQRRYYIKMRFDPTIFATGTDPLQLFLELAELGKLEKVVCHTEEMPPFEDLSVDDLYLWWEIWLVSDQEPGTLENVFIFVKDGNEIEMTEIFEPPPKQAAPTPPPKPQPEARAPKPPAPQQPQAKAQEPKQGSKQTSKPGKALVPAGKTVTHSATIRVETDKLDKLVNLVGELVIGVARVNQISEGDSNSEMSSAVEALDHISRDLQEQVMRVRMIPVEGTFNRFQRVVRDLASEMGKKIHLEMSGTETELDKNVIEQIADPLKHLIRNSADHGLESPQERASLGKPETGTIWLRAYQQEGKIIIEVADDGKGIDKNKVLNKAIERGLCSPGVQLNDSEAYAFMFQPGLSTADKVTEVSGRGVGLDVVRQNIEELRGSVDVESVPGKGSTFRIKLPLTLAIIDGMTVRVGEDILTLPMLSILESMRPKTEELSTVEGGGELISVRGEYLPLIRLYKVFNLPTDRKDPTKALVVIIESVSKRFGILVDDILGEQQAVIKSLEQNYQKVSGVAGATILGDGRVSLILDIHGLEKLAFAD
jgi:two-component system chemotaxis sensor kinase CheA